MICEHEGFHDECDNCQAEMEASYREFIGPWRAEAPQRESLAIAREDLDMPDATDAELNTAILLRLK